jgi:hypothetical protein
MKQLTTKIDKQFLGRLCADAISNLTKACEKHPTFPGELTGMDARSLGYSLQEVLESNKTHLSTTSLIAYEEELEFFVETKKGNRVTAYNELVDLITVWLRVGLHLNDYVPHRVTESTKPYHPNLDGPAEPVGLAMEVQP